MILCYVKATQPFFKVIRSAWWFISIVIFSIFPCFSRFMHWIFWYFQVIFADFSYWASQCLSPWPIRQLSGWLYLSTKSTSFNDHKHCFQIVYFNFYALNQVCKLWAVSFVFTRTIRRIWEFIIDYWGYGRRFICF